MTKARRSKKSKASSSKNKPPAPESSVVAERIKRRKPGFDLITLREAADELGKTELQVLELAFHEKISVAILISSGKPLFISAEGVHRFMVDSQAKARVSDFMVYPSPQYAGDLTVPDAPLVFPPEPDTEVSIRTLRVLRDDVLRVKQEFQTADRDLEVLRIDFRTREIFYKGLAVDLPDTAFRLLGILAGSPGALIPIDDLINEASRHRLKDEIDPTKWAKNHKLTLMTALRELVGRKRIKHEEIDGLITTRRGSLRLNLAPDKIVFIEK